MVFRHGLLGLARRRAWTEVGAGTFALIATAAGLLAMVARAVNGGLSLGELAMFYQAFQQGLRLGGGLLGNAGKIFTSAVFLENLVEVLDLEPRIQEPVDPKPLPATGEIEFRQVAFRYPGGAKPALRELDLRIPQGQVVALLGPNGAGKTTIAKLLCRLYDVDSGRITIGGVDIRSLRLEELRGQIAVLAQRPMQYNATARDNLLYGDIAGSPEPATLDQALETAGAAEVVAKLPRGLDNMLGRSFALGAELSGGEWQRLATARSFVRDARILVLDEPTSAMDPWAEKAWAERVRAFAEGRTVILITHRLTTAMAADRVCVMEQGRVVQDGAPAELARDSAGPYARALRRES